MQLRTISKVYFLKLFQAKRAFILKQWLILTRVVAPLTYDVTDKHMKPLRVDKELAKLSGDVYDIRDYLFNGTHHPYKVRLYEILRGYYTSNKDNAVKDEEMVDFFDNHNDSLMPYISDTNDEGTDLETIVDGNDLFQDEYSIEEYGI